MNAPLPDRPLLLGDCVLRSDRHELRAADGRVHRLPRRQVELLLALASAPDQVWTRSALLEAVWPRRMVADEVLSRAIADLRVVLGCDARAPSYVETLPKTGYRWIAPTRWLDPDTGGNVAVAEDVPEKSPTPSAPTSGDADTPQRALDAIPTPPLSPDAGPTAALAPPGAVAGGEFAMATDPVRVPTSRARIKSGWITAAGVLAGAVLVLGWVWLQARSVHPAHPDRSPPAAPEVSADPDPDLLSRVAAAVPLTSDSAWEMQVDASNDGQWLVYARSAPFASERALMVRNLVTGVVHTLLESRQGVDSPSFALDGHSLFHRQCVPLPCVWQRLRHTEMAPTTPAPEPVPEAVPAVLASAERAGLAIGPEGWVAASATDPDGLDWRPLDASGQPAAWRALTRPAQGEGSDRMPRWIPGTRRVAFVRGMPGLQTLHWLDVDHPGRIHRVDVPSSRIQDHRWWSSTEAWLASDLPGFRALVQWREDLGWRLLGQRGTRGLALLPGRGAVLEVAHYDADLYLQDLGAEASSAIRLAGSRRTESHPTLSADGRWLAFVSLREGQDQVWLQDLERGVEQRISPLGAAAQAVRPSFDAATTAVYFTRYEADGVVRAWRYRLDTRQAQALPELGDDVFALAPLRRTGAYVFATHRSDSSLQLWWQRSAGQPREPLGGAQQVAGFQVAGDRVWWQVQSAEVQGWHWMQPDSGAQGRVLPPAEGVMGRIRTWTATTDGLYIVDGEGRLQHWDGQDWQVRGSVQADSGPVTLAVDPRQGKVVSSRTLQIDVDLLQVSAQP